MTFEEMMSIGLLPDSTAGTPPIPGRDVLSEAHMIQLALNALYSQQADVSLHPFGNYYGADGAPHYGVLPNLSSAGMFAGHIERESLDAPFPTHLDDEYLGVSQSIETLLGLDALEDEEEIDPFYDPSGYSTDPNAPMIDGSFSAPAVMPEELIQHGDVNPAVYGFDSGTISGLADALGPDISSVSRLGGPFAGYSQDALTARLRDIVRRA